MGGIEGTSSGEVDSRDRLFSGGCCSEIIAVAYRVQRVGGGAANTMTKRMTATAATGSTWAGIVPRSLKERDDDVELRLS